MFFFRLLKSVQRDSVLACRSVKIMQISEHSFRNVHLFQSLIMYEAEEYHGGGGHHTQGEEADTERARLKRSASLSSSSHRSHHSRHREAHGVNTSANQKALLWHIKANQRPDTEADYSEACSRSGTMGQNTATTSWLRYSSLTRIRLINVLKSLI